MIRLYESPGNTTRTRISVILLTGLILLGIWYPVFVALAAPAGGGIGPWVLSFAFIVSGIAGLTRVLNHTRNRVIAMDMDDATGKVVIWLRSPLGARRIKTGIRQLSNWRYDATGRSGRARFHGILADLPKRSRPIRFELPPKLPVPDGLRLIAPDAVADYERDIGIA